MITKENVCDRRKKKIVGSNHTHSLFPASQNLRFQARFFVFKRYNNRRFRLNDGVKVLKLLVLMLLMLSADDIIISLKICK